MRHSSALLIFVLTLGSSAGVAAQSLEGCSNATTPAWLAEARAALSTNESDFGVPAGQMPSCASPLFRRIHDAVNGVGPRGTIPPGLITSSRNLAEPRALEQGPRIFSRMGDLIAGAESEVLLQNWRWNTSSVPHAELMDGLRRLHESRAKTHPFGPPVSVKLLVNVRALEDPRMLPRLAEAVEKLNLDHDLVHVTIGGHPHLGPGALHTKTLIVDGRHAVTTGANVQPNHDTLDDNYDLGFALHGDVAASMRAEFANAWASSKRWACGSGGTWAWDVLGTGASPCWAPTFPLPPLPLRFQLPDVSLLRTCVPMMVVTRPPAQNPFANDDRNPQNQAFLAAIRGATTRIRILTPNINDSAVEDALAAAIARGVTVELVTGNGYQDFAESLPTRGGTNAGSLRNILSKARALGAPDPCRQLRARWYTRNGAVVRGNVDHSIHAKYLSIDGRLSIIGSANLDEQSFNNSRELNVVVDDASLTTGWDRQVFEDNFAAGVPAESCR